MSNLRFWRQERGLTQIALADLSGVPKYLIQLVEQGVRSLSEEERIKITAVLGIDDSKLIGVWGQLPLALEQCRGGEAK